MARWVELARLGPTQSCEHLEVNLEQYVCERPLAPQSLLQLSVYLLGALDKGEKGHDELEGEDGEHGPDEHPAVDEAEAGEGFHRGSRGRMVVVAEEDEELQGDGEGNDCELQIEQQLCLHFYC